MHFTGQNVEIDLVQHPHRAKALADLAHAQNGSTRVSHGTKL
jgi:hypothetical protein